MPPVESHVETAENEFFLPPEKNKFEEKPRKATKRISDVQKNEAEKSKKEKLEEKLKNLKPRIYWGNAVALTLLHVMAVRNLVTYIPIIKPFTFIYYIFIGILSGVGVTAGAHRYFTHRTYKAKPQLKALLLFLYSMAGQNPIFDWVRDHRVHHKYSETDADPHNANRGFFFAHCGWLMQSKHPEVIRRGNEVDMSDIINDPMCQFHRKYFIWLQLVICFILPTIFPPLLWGEDWLISFWANSTVRYCIVLNGTWLVNSAAHMFGNRPYHSGIGPVQSWWVSIFSAGEGWHNYHHVFPWDYKADEYGPHSLNFTTYFIEFFERIGWAYDLKHPSKDLVKMTAEKFGDDTHPVYRREANINSQYSESSKI